MQPPPFIREALMFDVLVLLIFPIAKNLAEYGVPDSAQCYDYGCRRFIQIKY